MSEHEKKVSLQPSESGAFDFREGPAFARSYLSTYYNQPPTADETAVSEFLVEEFARRAPSGRFIEIGCGPTVHHVFPFAPHVAEIHMADYLPDNLEQVRQWQTEAADAHDWSQYVAMTLQHEGQPHAPGDVAARIALARSKVTHLAECDLMHDTPAEFVGQYDAVGCFYCAEEVGITLEEWRRVLARVASYAKPGGMFYMAALAGMDTYDVRDAEGTVVEYPCANISEPKVSAALAELGFAPESMTLKTSQIAQPDCGVTATLVVAAQKS